MTGVLIFMAAAVATSGVGEVPLTNIFDDPSRYENQILVTCGDANTYDDILLIRNRIFGRSRGGMRLKHPLDQSGYVCIRAKVVRALTVETKPLPDGVIISHPHLALADWQLDTVEVLPN